MKPECMKLNDKQMSKLHNFQQFIRNTISPERILNQAEEDCTMASPMTFTIFTTGLGDVITCSCFGYLCDLTIDDENELCGGNTCTSSEDNGKEVFEMPTKTLEDM